MLINLMTDELIRDEGKRNKVYTDTVGVPTIGVGRNLLDVGLSDDEVSYLLGNDIQRVCAELDAEIPWWRDMSEERQRCVTNMVFNLGITGLMGFKNTLAAMKDGRYDAAADGMLNSHWSSQVGQRAQRLSTMMREG